MDPNADETDPVGEVGEVGEQAGWGGSPGSPGWRGGHPPAYPAPPVDPYEPRPPVDPYEQPPVDPYEQPPVDPYEQPPIWAGPPSPPSPMAPPPSWEDQQPPKAYLRQQPEPPGPGRRSGALIAALAVILVLVAAGTAFTLVKRSHGGDHAAARRPGASQAGSPAHASPQVSQTGGAKPASPTPSPSAGDAAVAVAPAVAANPAAPRVVSLLARYFAAINGHDYQAFRPLLDGPIQRVETAQRFRAGFRSTRDSGATLTGLSVAPDGRVAAVVAFTSHQSPADSPDQSACTHWTITLYLEHAGGSYLIGAPPAGYQALRQSC